MNWLEPLVQERAVKYVNVRSANEYTNKEIGAQVQQLATWAPENGGNDVQLTAQFGTFHIRCAWNRRAVEAVATKYLKNRGAGTGIPSTRRRPVKQPTAAYIRKTYAGDVDFEQFESLLQEAS